MDKLIHEVPKVLIVDDVATNVSLLQKMIIKMGYEPLTSTSVEQAIEVINHNLPNVILSDIVMPEVNGYQFCEILKKNVLTRDIPVIFVSAAGEVKDRQKAFDLGAVDFIHKPYEYVEIAMRLDTHLKMYYMKKELETKNKRLNTVIQEQAKQLEKEQKRLLKAFSTFAEGHKYYGTHVEFVTYNARLLAQALNFTEKYENKISAKFVDAIEISASIHDIGKVTIPKEILNKTGKLSKEDLQIIRQHTVNGYELLKEVYGDIKSNDFVEMALDVVRSHHENWDGSGYPDGLKGDEIPLPARILAIIDSYDALLREQCYRPQHTEEETKQIMNESTGIKFDPYIMDTFLKIEKQLKRTPQREEGNT